MRLHTNAYSAGMPKEEDFALVICPPWGTRIPPMWIAMLAAKLRAAGLRGACHDVNSRIYRSASRQVRALWRMDKFFAWCREQDFHRVLDLIGGDLAQAAEQILIGRPRVVGFTTTSANLRASLHLAGLIKQAAPSTRVVLGGPAMYWITELDGVVVPISLRDQLTGHRVDPEGLVDVAVRGEADDTVAPLFNAIMEGRDPLEVPGCMVPHEADWRATPPQRLLDLDRLPIPDYSDLISEGEQAPRLPLLTSRGCPRACSFCNDCYMQGAYCRRSADHLFREVRSLHLRYGTRFFQMVDLAINGDLEQLERFCELILEAGLEVDWAGQAIIDPAMDIRLLRKMERAGCKSLTFGVESFSQPVVDAMNKGFLVSEALQVLRDSNSAGIPPAINILVSFPGETDEHFEETCQVLESSRQFIGRVGAVNACHLTSHSRLWQVPDKYGIQTDMPEHWFRWTGPHGNSYELRKQRLNHMARHATRLGLRPLEQNLYDEWAARITGLELQDDKGQPRSDFRPGELLRVVLRYELLESLWRPVFRVQLLRAGDDVLVYGQNTARAGVDPGLLEAGPGSVALELEQLRLAPGEYRVTVGIWPDEDSTAPYDVRHGALDLRVLGEVVEPRSLVQLPFSTCRAAEADPTKLAHVLSFGPGDAVPPPSLATGESLAALLPLPELNGEVTRLQASLTAGEALVHKAVVPRERLQGGTLLRLLYDRLPLLAGTYQLSMELGQAGEGQPLLRATRPFIVDSPTGDGGGIVFHRA